MKFLKGLMVAIIALTIISTLAPKAQAALLADTNTGKDQMDAFTGNAGLAAADETTAPALVATIIKSVLSVLGVIFVVLIIIAGFKWMTAGGNEKDVEEAQKRIKTSIIGLIIILSAYAITAFVFNNLPSQSGGSSTDGPAVVTGG